MTPIHPIIWADPSSRSWAQRRGACRSNSDFYLVSQGFVRLVAYVALALDRLCSARLKNQQSHKERLGRPFWGLIHRKKIKSELSVEGLPQAMADVRRATPITVERKISHEGDGQSRCLARYAVVALVR
jgi:hypothetical protein